MSLTKAQIESAERHPLSAAWGNLPAKLYEEMRIDIQVNGLLKGEILYTAAADGTVQVLDGWHRHLACLELGRAPVYRKLRGKDFAEQVIALNGLRRSLTDSARIKATLACRDWKPTPVTQDKKPEEVPSGTSSDKTSNKEVAAATGTKPKQVAQVKSRERKKAGKTDKAHSKATSKGKAAAVQQHEPEQTATPLTTEDYWSIVVKAEEWRKFGAVGLPDRIMEGRTTLEIMAADPRNQQILRKIHNSYTKDALCNEVVNLLRRTRALELELAGHE